MGSPRQEYWSGLPFASPGHLPDPGMERAPPALAPLPLSRQGSPSAHRRYQLFASLSLSSPSTVISWVHPCSCERRCFTPVYSSAVVHRECVPHLLYPPVCRWAFRERVSLYLPSSLAGADSESIICTKLRKGSCSLTRFPHQALEGSSSLDQVQESGIRSLSAPLDGSYIKDRSGISSLLAYQSYWRAGFRNNQAYSTCQGRIAKTIPGILFRKPCEVTVF